MKQSRRYLLFALPIGMLLMIFFFTQTVFADVVLEKVSSLLSEQYDLDSYSSYLDSSTGFTGFMFGDTQPNMINGIANLLFSLQKVAWSVVDVALKLMFEADALGKLSGIVTSLSEALWNEFKANFLPILLVIALGMIAFSFFIKSSIQAYKEFAKLLFVLFVSMLWFQSGESILNTFNNISSDIQVSVMSVANQTDFANEVASTDGDMTDSVTVIRNMYFDTSVQKPYFLMNYGTANENEINENYGDSREYLTEDASNEDNIKEIETKIKQNDSDNPFITTNKVGYKLTVSFFSMFSTVLYGVPLFVIAFCNLLLQLAALVLYYALPVLVLLSIIPRYSNAILNGIVKVISLLLMKGLLGLAILIVSFISIGVDLLFEPTNVGVFIVNIIVKGLILIFGWKYRDKIIQTLTNNLVQTTTPKAIHEGFNNTKERIQERVKEIKYKTGSSEDSSSITTEYPDVATVETGSYFNQFENMSRSQQAVQTEIETEAVKTNQKNRDIKQEVVTSEGESQKVNETKTEVSNEKESVSSHFVSNSNDQKNEDIHSTPIREEQEIELTPIINHSQIDESMVSAELPVIEREQEIHETEHIVSDSTQSDSSAIPESTVKEQEIRVEQSVQTESVEVSNELDHSYDLSEVERQVDFDERLKQLRSDKKWVVE
ncbi:MULTISPECIES: CD3337/EF1877 family mobilome membrane protein [unclassified Enterococcus]|uniref:CD3337/EF1877 family mobilome membrane protein n=1 Tax=unclassified Enterococcus TaxID=2608891 RepID=UPI001902FFBB|nr:MULTISPECIES: hypothetical protein [unclassified Enterococcus]MBK0036051.1 hypothetical protein [Enterococcus sp. S52]MBK0068709.1 hypothetical protein [Enterococcus sp. S53]MBK0139302.1 hypothetical protein [Enterococcus sp. S76]MBK0142937.1 hypothetical protein [Enterococcus sp. S77]